MVDSLMISPSFSDYELDVTRLLQVRDFEDGRQSFENPKIYETGRWSPCKRKKSWETVIVISESTKATPVPRDPNPTKGGVATFENVGKKISVSPPALYFAG